MRDWYDLWGDWCGKHPATLLYIVLVGTVNVVLNIVNLFVK